MAFGSYYPTSGYGSYRPSGPAAFNPVWSAYQNVAGPPKTGGMYLGQGRITAFGSLFNPNQMIPGYTTNTPTNAAAPPPSTPAPGGGAGSIPSIGNLDISSDPILQKMQALTQQQISDATAEAIRARTQLAIGYGDPNLVKQLDVGKGKGDRVASQAKNNPFSTLAELQRGYTRRNVFDINRPLSDQSNLFYSTERGRQLALSGEQNLRDRSQAGNAVQQRIAEISQQLLQAKLNAQMNLLQAEQDAYNRALQRSLYSAGVG